MKSIYHCPKCGKDYLDNAHEVNSLCVYCKTPAIEVKQVKRVSQTTIKRSEC